MSETAESPFQYCDHLQSLFVYDNKDKNALYYPIPNPQRFLASSKILDGCKVMLSLSKSGNVAYTLYDREYVYDIQTTLDVKNFRDNAKRFVRDTFPIKIEPLQKSNQLPSIEMLKQWYQKHYAALQDFGQTIYTLEHFSDLGLEGDVFYINDAVKGISLYQTNMTKAIHITSKDMGQPFLQDYMRFYTYEKLLDKGVTTVYDGSDCDDQGLAVYKLKLRPKLIIPIYSLAPKHNLAGIQRSPPQWIANRAVPKQNRCS